MTTPTDERIAMLEVQKRYIDQQIDEMRQDIREIKADVKELADNDRKRSSFVLGIVFTVSTVWAALGGVFAFIRHKFGA